ncbi:MAG: gamma-glutamylcyclotransferase [Rhodobacteraceae bacterium]|nr:gamma-glutamylcyclotransferase [Alphaproteobacteria bacterium]NNK68408.1 gamma-glutamylcyclotransferase [Paracoccaceae bacterium]
MPLPDHAFRHHPELKSRIEDPETSFFRDFDLEEVDKVMLANGFDLDYRHPDAVREALRRDMLAERPAGDLWVFAYGSLMWNPALIFEEVRRAHTPDYQRSFCIWDDGGRGSKETPGLMGALDVGTGCTGFAFRIAEDRIDDETYRLCKRELIMDAYLARFIPLETAQGRITALTFVANHDCDVIVSDLSLDEQARMIAQASGFLGTSREYLESMAGHLSEFGISDPYVEDLLARMRRVPRAAE